MVVIVLRPFSPEHKKSLRSKSEILFRYECFLLHMLVQTKKSHAFTISPEEPELVQDCSQEREEEKAGEDCKDQDPQGD